MEVTRKFKDFGVNLVALNVSPGSPDPDTLSVGLQPRRGSLSTLWRQSKK